MAGGGDSGESGGSGGGNKSRARDHLANERTYLAWLRTAGSVMILGLAIAQFLQRGSVYAIAAGGILIAVGAAGLVYGTIRYHRVNDQIEREEYQTGARGRAAIIASTLLFLAVVASLVLLLLGRGDGSGENTGGSTDSPGTSGESTTSPGN